MNILGKNPFLTVTTDELDSNIAEATRRLESAKDRRKGQEDEQSRGKRVSEQGVLSGQTHRYAPGRVEYARKQTLQVYSKL